MENINATEVAITNSKNLKKLSLYAKKYNKKLIKIFKKYF